MRGTAFVVCPGVSEGGNQIYQIAFLFGNAINFQHVRQVLCVSVELTSRAPHQGRTCDRRKHVLARAFC